MGKRYYCDYCDKSFADNPVNRKNHLRGVIHNKMRKLHYDSFRDPGTILAEDETKLPCKRFYNTGSCDYGDGCRFSHMTEEKRQELLKQIEEENKLAERKTQEDMEQKQLTLDDWLAKKCKTVSSVKVEEVPQFSLPQALRNIPNIPPSLLPPKFEDFQNTDPVEWG
ncbi:hypothetical protein CHS0354_028897 [Potamilus streckersoni]|uniref:Zinc finger matrin-type protein 5 n=1 Tax=Potamilus streckersoni TaxID=2493646 RepID=A0AAE0SBC8_9BIVA|nr:hypothetical protein CHS0354_028897 [Potamilus streckersoni]